jgi:NAD(P)-dependent dehydrogenase (short-subunit alcohol dehydrogenase family)
MRWTATDLPDLSGLTVLVTGASSGLGEASTIALASRGAHVVLATRNAAKTDEVIGRIRARHPAASLEHLDVDLADLGSVRDAAARFLQHHDRLDRLIANAGLMATPQQRTVDGFELQFGVNHLGHFALVGELLPAVRAAQHGRVVTVSSLVHRMGSIDLDDLNWERTRYRRWQAYARSKLANLLFVLELQHRFTRAGVDAISVGAHPGYSRTALQTTGPTMQGGISATITGIGSRIGNLVMAQSSARGALPQLYATTAADVDGGSYWGPGGPGETRGHPAPAARSSAALDVELARALWAASEELTGVTYDLPDGP